MSGLNMATITASLQKCSLDEISSSNGGVGADFSRSCGYSNSSSSSDALDLNSHISLPYNWEQCLDLKTGEVYYINWRTGMKSKEDPRMMSTSGKLIADLYSEEEEDDDDDSSSYDSVGSSTESSPSPYSDEQSHNININISKEVKSGGKEDGVLVVAGCKSCLMYFMVPKEEVDCPKCCGQLLHFDRSHN